jgi:3-hydroxyacyl-[acyl-carrier-protein] dehydratase
LSDDVFDDHFPTKPIMPGVLLLEGMAQLSGLLLEEGVFARSGQKVKALMSIVEKAKFRKPALPGDGLVFHADVTSCNELGGQVTARTEREGERIAECRLTFSFHRYENPRLERRRAEILNLLQSGISADADE